MTTATHLRPGEVEAVLSWCRAQGVRLWVDGDRLRYEAPAGLLSADDRAYLKELKPALIEALTNVAIDGPPLEAFPGHRRANVKQL